MARKKKLTPEEFKALLPRILAAADAPMAVMEFEPSELDLDLIDVDLDESQAIVFSSTSPAVSGDPVLPGGAKLPACGTHPICIRIPVSTLRAYKAKAARTGASYQTLMIRALRAGISG